MQYAEYEYVITFPGGWQAHWLAVSMIKDQGFHVNVYGMLGI